MDSEDEPSRCRRCLLKLERDPESGELRCPDPFCRPSCAYCGAVGEFEVHETTAGTRTWCMNCGQADTES